MSKFFKLCVQMNFNFGVQFTKFPHWDKHFTLLRFNVNSLPAGGTYLRRRRLRRRRLQQETSLRSKTSSKIKKIVRRMIA